MSKKKQKKPQPQTSPKYEPFWASWSSLQLRLMGLGFIVLVLLIQHAPMVFDGMSPLGTDVIGSVGKMHQVKAFEEETGERALWNPNIFSGMPVYHRLSPREPAVDTILTLLGNTPGRNGFIYYLVGAVGFFFLTQFWGVPIWGSVLASLAFVLMPHFEVLLQAGHFQKFRPIMLMPWVLFAFTYLLKSGNWRGCLFFMLIFSLQIRTKHYQVVFYTLLILLFVGVAYTIPLLREKKWSAWLKRLGLLALAAVMAVLMSLQPLIPVKEYTPYSIRGGTGEAGSDGLDLDYATQWSFSPKEMLSLLIPYAYGGSSVVIYQGDAVPQVKGQRVPGYWGDMPSTEGGDYIGVLTFILAVVGAVTVFRKKQGEGIALLVFIPFAFLLSFGRHMPLLYNLFFQFVPFFNKFRVPVMALVAIYFVTVSLAALGLKALFSGENKQSLNRIVFGLAGFMIVLSLTPFVFQSLFPLEKAGEVRQYGEQSMQVIRAVRLDLFRGDALRLLFLSILGCGAILLYLREKLPKAGLGLVLGLLLLFDLVSIDKRYLNNLGPTQHLESTYFTKSETNRYLLNDKSVYRIFPLQQNVFQDNNWSYYHQSIGGYSPAKLRIYQDVAESCIFGWTHRQMPVNWNMINMLNGKYVVVQGKVDEPNLELINQDSKTGYLTYLNKSDLGRAWFVGETEVIQTKSARLISLNDPAFKPDSIAILEQALTTTIQTPREFSVKTTLFEPNRVFFEVETDVQSLLVVSEVFYPKGWKATMDGKEIPIFKTNHILRSVVVPPGKHEIQMVFAPRSYKVASVISAVTNTGVLLGLLGLGLAQILSRRREEH